MKKYLVLSIILILASCKNAAYEMGDVSAVDNATVEVEFDKVAFYEEYIREKFEERVEEIRIAQKHPELFTEETDPYFSLSYGVYKFKQLEINLIENADDWTNSSSFKIYPEYTYNYKLTKVFSDSITKQESRFSSQVSIKEDYKIIDGDSIPTVQVIWQN